MPTDRPTMAQTLHGFAAYAAKVTEGKWTPTECERVEARMAYTPRQETMP